MYTPVCWTRATIYQIYSPSKPHLRYVGATASPLRDRFRQHMNAYNRWLKGRGPWTSAFDVFDKCDDFTISEIEKYPCEGRRALEARERAHINAFPCVNRHWTGAKAWTNVDGKFLSAECVEKKDVVRPTERNTVDDLD